jgi:alpha-galactosidase
MAPFMASKNSTLFHEHPEWFLRDAHEKPVQVGLTWEGRPFALDTSHPELLRWLTDIVRMVRTWGFSYLKLDFLYAGALPGRRYLDIPREEAYRNALRVIREAAGDAYILGCGAPIIPSLGLVDGLRIGPDVTPYWVNKPFVEWLNNPSDASSVNAIRTCLHRLWLNPLVHTDPDVVFFRSRYNDLSLAEKQLLKDLGTISCFKATSDLPHWLEEAQVEELSQYLLSEDVVHKLRRYQYSINGRLVDFEPYIQFEHGLAAPIWLARNLGLLTIVLRQALPAVWESHTHYK